MLARLSPAVLFLVLAGTACATPDPAVNAPAPRADQKVSTWMVEEPGGPGKIIFMRNNTAEAVRITRLTFTECENIRNSCLPHDPNVTLGPGEMRQVEVVRPARRDQAYSFRYTFGWSGVQ